MKRFLSLLLTLAISVQAQAAFFIPPGGVTRDKLATGAVAKQSVVSKTTTYTAASSDDVILVSTASAWTLSLPTAVGISGKIYVIKKTSTDTNQLTIDPNGTETIDGQTTIGIVAKGGWYRIVSDGSNWQILDGKDPWRVDANIQGANIDLGTADVSSYTGMENASLSLTNNTSGVGVLTAKIPCSSTNAPSGTTCAAGNESVGVSFDIPKPVDVLACVSFQHSVGNTTGAVLFAAQVVETPSNAQTISQEGHTRMMSSSSAANTVTAPHRNCGTLSFSTSGTKTIRLFYEQDTTATTSSTVFADASAAVGQRDIHWEIYPLN